MSIINIILNNGKSLILDADVQIEWVQENMFFEDDVSLRGKYSYPFTIDRMANSEALDFIDEIQQRGRVRRYTCTVQIEGSNFYKGQINILDWTDKQINIAITRNTEDVDTTQYLDEMDLGTYTGIADYTARNTDYNKFYPEVDYQFPQFYNYDQDTLSLYGSTGGAFNYMIMNWRNGNTEAALALDVAVPHFYLLSVIEKICIKLGLNLKTALKTDTALNNMVIYNPIVPVSSVVNEARIFTKVGSWDFKTAGVSDRSVSFAMNVGTVINWDIFEIDNTGAIVNTFNLNYTVTSGDLASGRDSFYPAIKTAILAVATGSSLDFEQYISTPFVSYIFILKFGSGNRMAIRMSGVGIDSDPISPSADVPLYVDFQETVSYSDVIMDKHLPHITVSTFLNCLRKNFNLAITLNELNNELVIVRRTNQLKMVNKPHYIPLAITEGAPNTPPNYVLSFNQDSDHDLLTATMATTATNYPEATLLPATEINTECGTLQTETLRNSNSGYGEMPKVSQLLGNYGDPVTFGLRFLRLVGYVADNAGKHFVQATNDALTPDEVFTDYYEDWYNFIKRMNKAPIYYFDFGRAELQDVFQGPWLVDKNDFMWKRITTVIHNTKGIQVSKVEGYKA